MNYICKSKGKPQEQTESRRLSVDVGIYKHCHTWLDKTDIIIAWENSRHLLQEPFKLSPLLTTENSTYETKVKYL